MNRHRDYKQDAKGVSYSEFLEEIHLWYAKNKNHDLEAELLPLIHTMLIQ